MTRLAPVAAAALCLTAAPSAAQPAGAAPAARAFVTLHDADTLVVERAERAPDGTVTSRLTLRGGAGQAAGARFLATFLPAPDARVRRATLDVTPPGANAPAQRATMTFEGHGDSVQVAVENGPSQTIAAAPGTLPYVNLSIAGLELILRRARVLAAATRGVVTVPLYAGPGTPAIAATVTRVGADSALLSLGSPQGGAAGGVEVRLRTTAADQVLGMRVPAQGLVTTAADPRAGAS